MGGYLLSQRGDAAEFLSVALRQEEEQSAQDWIYCAGHQLTLLHRS